MRIKYKYDEDGYYVEVLDAETNEPIYKVTDLQRQIVSQFLQRGDEVFDDSDSGAIYDVKSADCGIEADLEQIIGKTNDLNTVILLEMIKDDESLYTIELHGYKLRDERAMDMRMFCEKQAKNQERLEKKNK